MQNFWADFKAWSAQPFSADMPAGHWFLFIGLLLVVVILWSLVLRHITDVLKKGV
jgi:hypothetical protein